MACDHGSVSRVSVASCTLTISSAGNVTGWDAIVARMNPVLQEKWRLDRVAAQFDSVTLQDVVLFIVVERTNRSANRASRNILSAALHTLLQVFLIPRFDSWVLNVYAQTHDMNARPRLLKTTTTRRISGGMDPFVVWDVLEKTRLTSRASERTVLRILDNTAELDSVALSNASTWAAKEFSLYIHNQLHIFQPLNKLMLVADPSTHAGQETMFACIYSWELDHGAYGVPQIIPPGKHLGPGEFAMDDDLASKVAARKVERVHALREWQSISSLLHHATNKSVDDFDTPVDCILRPVGEREVRVVDRSDPMIDRAFVVDTSATPNIWRRVLPDHQSPGAWPQLTICIDSGAVGRAGAAFAKNHLQLNVFVIYDYIHRLIRDVRLATEHSKGGDVQRALLHMSFVWSLHAKPFGSGVWFEVKKQMLKHFMDTHTPDSALFRLFAPQIARDLKPPHPPPCADADFERIWNLMPEMPGFSGKLEPIKLMRWFSANGRHKAESSSFWLTKMVLVDHLRGEAEDIADLLADPSHIRGMTPKEELRQLKNHAGGFQLAEQVLCPWLHDTIRVYYYGTMAQWSKYTDHVQNNKGAKDNLARIIKFSRGGWTTELEETFKNTLYTRDHLVDMGMDWRMPRCDLDHQQTVAATALDFATKLCFNRSYSLIAFEVQSNLHPTRPSLSRVLYCSLPCSRGVSRQLNTMTNRIYVHR